MGCFNCYFDKLLLQLVLYSNLGIEIRYEINHRSRERGSFGDREIPSLERLYRDRRSQQEIVKANSIDYLNKLREQVIASITGWKFIIDALCIVNI